jgi:putative membrane protein
MTAHPFLTAAAKQAVQHAVADIESRTAAEIIVTVRRASDSYREADYLGGFLGGLLVLIGLLYLPPLFPLWTFVPNVVLGFAIGAFAVSRIPWCRQQLTARRVLLKRAEIAARAGFVERGYSRLPGRNAVLIYVAVLEGHVEVVADAGVGAAASQAGWAAACAGLTAALQRQDVPRFVAAMRVIGDLLEANCPRLSDDRNELPDEVHAW